MENNRFPENFLWGAATASAQIEGGWNEGGRTPSIWDTAPSNKIKNGDNCHIACDHFHRMKEDVALMKEIGLKSYRFSISWSRVIPEEGKINPEGIKFYSDLVNELLKNGIEPLVTIYHWDLPVWAYEKGGWLSKRIVQLFAEYTKAVVDALSDRVCWWMTMNEPQCFIMNSYLQGVHAPFKRRYLALSKLTRNCMLAHAEAVKVIRKYAKKPPKIGIVMATGSYVPDDDSAESAEKARKMSTETGMGLMGNRWWMDPILAGKPVRAYGVYSVSAKTAREAHQPLDFVGLNIYSPYNYSEWGGDKNADTSSLEKSSIGWVIDERVMYWTVKFIYERYRLPIMISENGMSDNDKLSDDGKIHDTKRINYLTRYLRSLKKAIAEGYPVLGYQCWSLLDNFEWAEGYDHRFGLIYTDYPTQKRILKDSAYEYKKIIETNGETL